MGHLRREIRKLNKRHAVVREAGKTVVINEEWDHALGRHVLSRSSFHDFRNFYRNRRVVVGTKNGKPQLEPLGHYWLDHPARRQYRGITFSPSEVTPGYFNLWRGFAVRERPGDWSRMRAHIHGNICSGDEVLFGYVLGWMALCVQKPGNPAEVALVLRGRRGVGKSFFGRWFGSLFGQHAVHIASTRHLMGNFNAHLEDAIFLFADEAFLAGDKQSEGMLKMLITEPVIPIERKGRDVRFVKNMTHLMIASNDDWVVPAGLDERRFCVIDVGDARAQDRAYFGAIVTEMENGGREAMLHDLRHRDLSAYRPSEIPVTEALRQQKILSMAPHEKWWLQKLNDGRLLPSHEGWRTEVPRDALYDDYIVVTGKAGVSPRAIATELGLHLAKLLPEGYPRRFQRTILSRVKDHGTGENVTESQRKWMWGFPPLRECRSHFDTIANCSLDFTT